MFRKVDARFTQDRLLLHGDFRDLFEQSKQRFRRLLHSEISIGNSDNIFEFDEDGISSKLSDYLFQVLQIGFRDGDWIAWWLFVCHGVNRGSNQDSAASGAQRITVSHRHAKLAAGYLLTG